MDEKRAEARRQWVASHPLLNKQRSMNRRKSGHDYCAQCLYMVTVVVDGRQPVFGSLVNNNDEYKPFVWVKPTSLGTMAHEEWNSLVERFPQVKPLWFRLMPDHIHGLIQVTERIERPLGHVIAHFKAKVAAAARRLWQSQRPLWQAGFNDRILQGHNQLQRWIGYLEANPLRLWVKQHHPDFFTQQVGLSINGRQVAVMGNRFLLDYPVKLQVKCSRRMTEEEIEAMGDGLLDRACVGDVVLVSPVISQGEKHIMRRAFEQRVPQIVLLDKGFAPLAKPQGRLFKACAEGRLLLVAAMPFEGDSHRLTRDLCLQLNDLAAAICEGDIEWETG